MELVKTTYDLSLEESRSLSSFFEKNHFRFSKDNNPSRNRITYDIYDGKAANERAGKLILELPDNSLPNELHLEVLGKTRLEGIIKEYLSKVKAKE